MGKSYARASAGKLHAPAKSRTTAPPRFAPSAAQLRRDEAELASASDTRSSPGLLLPGAVGGGSPRHPQSAPLLPWFSGPSNVQREPPAIWRLADRTETSGDDGKEMEENSVEDETEEGSKEVIDEPVENEAKDGKALDQAEGATQVASETRGTGQVEPVSSVEVDTPGVTTSEANPIAASVTGLQPATMLDTLTAVTSGMEQGQGEHEDTESVPTVQETDASTEGGAVEVKPEPDLSATEAGERASDTAGQDEPKPAPTEAGGIRFALPELPQDLYTADERAELEQSRADATAMASTFLGDASQRVQSATAMGEEIPTLAQEAAGAARGSITAAIQQQQAALHAHIEGVRVRVREAATAANATATGSYQATVAAIRRQTASSRAQVEQAHQRASDALGKRENEEVARIPALYASADVRYRGEGGRAYLRALAAGRARQKTYLDKVTGKDDSLLDGPLTDNRWKARADAAVGVAQQYATGLGQEAGKQASEAQKGKSRDLESVRAVAASARQTLAAQRKAALQSLESAQAQSLSRAGETRRALTLAVQKNLAAALSSLAQQEQAQTALLTRYGNAQAEAIERDAGRAGQSLQQGVGQAVTSMQGMIAQVRAALDGSDTPAPDELGVVLQDLLAQLDGVLASTREQVDRGMSVSRQGVQQGAERVVQALGTLVQDSTAESEGAGASMIAVLSKLGTDAAETFPALQRSHAGVAAQIQSASSKGFQEVEKGIASAFAKIDKNLETNLQASITNLGRAFDTAVKVDLQRAMGKYEEEAAAQVQPRWKKIAKILLVVAVIVVVALVAGPAVIAAVGAAAGVLGASGAVAGVIGAVVGGAIVGAAASSVIQMGTNLIDGKNILDGVGKAALVGAIGGALGGAGGLIGNSLGAAAKSGLTQKAIELGVDAAFDIAGEILGNLAVGDPITMEGILIGAGIGAGISLSTAGLGKLVKLGTRTSGAPAPAAATGQAGKGRGQSIPADARPRASTGSDAAPGGRAHHDTPEVEPGVVAMLDVGGGHQLKVLKDGRIVRCSTCTQMELKYAAELKANPALQARLAEVKKIENPKEKIAAAEKLENELIDSQRRSIQNATHTKDGKAIEGSLERLDNDIKLNDQIVGGVPKDFAGHHIIGVELSKGYAVMRYAAEKLGYNINRASNGIALPTTEKLAKETGLPLHNGKHLGAKHDGSAATLLAKRLDALQAKYASGKRGKPILDEIRDIEDTLRKKLQLNQVRLQSMDPNYKP